MTAGSGAPGGGAPGATSGLGLGVGSGTAMGMGPGASTTSMGLGQTSTGPMGFNQGNVSSAALGMGQGNAMGVGPASSPSSSTSVATPVQNANQNAQNSNAVLGLSNIGQSLGKAPTSVLGNTTAQSGHFGFQVPPVNAVMSSTLGVPVTTTDGGFVTHGNLSGQVAGTPITPADVANAEMANQLGDSVSMLGDLGIPPISPTPPSVLSVPAAIFGFLAQMASAQTAQNVANTRGAIALAGPGMGAPSAAFGGNPLTGTGHPMGLNTGSSGSTPYSLPATPEVQALVEAFAAAPQPLADPVTGVQPFSTPVQNTLIDSILQNALAQPTQQGGVLPNRVFEPQIENILQQFKDQVV
jgi:hypothetical protein